MSPNRSICQPSFINSIAIMLVSLSTIQISIISYEARARSIKNAKDIILDRCNNNFEKMHSIHSSAGGSSSPQELKDLVAKQTYLPVRADRIFDQEWLEMRKNPPVANITITNQQIESIAKQNDINNTCDPILLKVLF